MALTLDPPIVQISGIDNAVGAFARVPGFVRHENYDAVMGTEVDLLKHPVVSAAVGTAAMAAGAAEADRIALADRVIEGVDLPAIIRESTNSMTAEVMTDVRTQGERADDVVSGIVDRMLGRDRENR